MPDIGDKNLSQVPSIQSIDDLRIFRNFFAHVKFPAEGDPQFELGAEEVWVQESIFMKNLSELLQQELLNIKELTDFEKGLQYAQLRQLEIVRLQYEYFANPFYNDLGSIEV